MRRLFLLLLFALILSCTSRPPALTETGVTDFLPAKPVSVVQVPSYREAITEGFSMTTHLFGRETGDEIQSKIFQILSRQWRIPLLDINALEKTGADLDRPLLLVSCGAGAFYASIPVKDRKKVRRTLDRLFPGMTTTRGKGFSTHQNPDRKNLRVLMTENRLYLLYRTGRIVKKKGAYPAALFKKKKNRFRVWLSAKFVRESGLPILSATGAAILLEYSRYSNRLQLHSLVYRKNIPSVFSTLLPASLKIPDRLFTWKKQAGFPGRAVAPDDLLFTVFSVSPGYLWERIIHPLLRKEVVKRIGVLGFLASKFFSKGKSPIDMAINRYAIKKGIINRLTGRAALRLRGVSSRRSGLLDAGQLSLLLEAKDAQNAQELILKLGSLLELARLRLREWGEGGFTYYDIPLLRRGILRHLYLSRMGRIITFSLHKQEVLGSSNGKLPDRGGRSYAAGGLAWILNRRMVRCWVSLSISKILVNLNKFFDWTTRANLGPLLSQLGKLSRITLTMSRSSALPLLSTEFTLRGTPVAIDPFRETTGETDFLLYGLGAFFFSLLLAVLFRYIYKKTRYRN